MSFIYDEVLKKLEEVLVIFGEVYFECVYCVFIECWIDVYVNKGKRLGVYLGGFYDINVFMFFNW